MVLKKALIFIESPTTRGAVGLDFSATGGKKQRRGSALIGAGVTGGKAPCYTQLGTFPLTVKLF